MLSVTTKTGDKGQSGLANGQRLSKDAPIFEVLGTQDELNSWLGLIVAQLGDSFADQKNYLLNIQDTLFYIGAELAQSPKAKLAEDALRELEAQAESLQSAMAEGWTTQFLYPGGTPAAAITDLARAVSRRFERVVVRYSQEVPVSPVVLKYVNRLSDYLFVLRCYINTQEQFQERKFTSKPTYAQKVKKTIRASSGQKKRSRS